MPHMSAPHNLVLLLYLIRKIPRDTAAFENALGEESLFRRKKKKGQGGWKAFDSKGVKVSYLEEKRDIKKTDPITLRNAPYQYKNLFTRKELNGVV
jgi:hypothetical protein